MRPRCRLVALASCAAVAAALARPMSPRFTIALVIATCAGESIRGNGTAERRGVAKAAAEVYTLRDHIFAC